MVAVTLGGDDAAVGSGVPEGDSSAVAVTDGVTVSVVDRVALGGGVSVPGVAAVGVSVESRPVTVADGVGVGVSATVTVSIAVAVPVAVAGAVPVAVAGAVAVTDPTV